MTLEEFIEKCQKRPLPSNPMARVKVLARELAEGAFKKVFDKTTGFYIHYDIDERAGKEFVYILDKNLQKYFYARWNERYPDLGILATTGYLNSSYDKHMDSTYYKLTKQTFDLLEETESATIFISYKRSESSAFALLIEQSLLRAGLSPFLDKQLQAGDDWHAELENRIRDSDYLIILLGQETLKSEVTLREITWAIQYKTGIIPIWHNDFSFDIDDWPDLDSEISEAISSKHAIRVLEENPLLYDTALRELLNRFGITM